MRCDNADIPFLNSKYRLRVTRDYRDPCEARSTKAIEDVDTGHVERDCMQKLIYALE